eukprot:2620524-Ditylum_brightwellii.AAC.1
MSGPAGPGGLHSVALQGWFLHFGVISCLLWKSVARFAHWITNTFLSWAVIRAYATGWLVSIDKCSARVHPVGIGKVLQYLAGKAVIFM